MPWHDGMVSSIILVLKGQSKVRLGEESCFVIRGLEYDIVKITMLSKHRLCMGLSEKTLPNEVLL